MCELSLIAKYIAVSKNISYLGGNRTIAKYLAVSNNIYLSIMAATGPSLNISLCQKIFFIYGGNRAIAKYIIVSK